MGLLIPRLYAIVDPAQVGSRTLAEVCDGLLLAGVKLIQYRNKKATARELFEDCVRLLGRARRAGATFVVNDRADVAAAAGADGVHVGQDDLPVEMARDVVGAGRIVGFSTHNLDQVALADQTTADYIAFGPVFATQSKDQPDPVVGLEGLRRARQATRKPLVAIGGITLERAREVIDAGADSIAVIADLLRAPDIEARARAFLGLVGETSAKDG
jgi:thiamine-phosphate pyrophosphorylase